jgi:response regulator RpfG family c-di-GMP phosphodiesterase
VIVALLDSLRVNRKTRQILVLCEPNCGQSEIRNLLVSGDYHLIFANCLSEAFEILGNEPIQLIVSGVHLEDGDSYEFLNVVKASPNWREIPFVFLCLKRTQVANYVDHALELAAKALGATRYVSVDAHSRAEIRAEIASYL